MITQTSSIENQSSALLCSGVLGRNQWQWTMEKASCAGTRSAAKEASEAVGPTVLAELAIRS